MKGITEHRHEVDLKARLIVRTEGVNIAVGLLRRNVLLVVHEAIVDAGKGNKFEEAGIKGSSMILAVCSKCSFLRGSVAEKMSSRASDLPIPGPKIGPCAIGRQGSSNAGESARLFSVTMLAQAFASKSASKLN